MLDLLNIKDCDKDAVDEKPNSYSFDTQKHLKIWFSSNPEIFMNPENQLRLVRLRSSNPEISITLLYSSELLNRIALENLRNFCAKHHITPLDTDTDLLPLCVTPNDKEIFKFAKEELSSFREGKGGNLAAASDLFRLMTSLLELGTYSDFDTDINVVKLKRNITIEGPILYNGSSLLQQSSFPLFIETPIETPMVNNDILGIARNENGNIDPDAQRELERIQETILKNYKENILSVLDSIVATSPELVQSKPLTLLYLNGAFTEIKNSKPDMRLIEFRDFIDKTCSSLFGYIRCLGREERACLESRVGAQLACKLTEALRILENMDFPKEFTEDEIRLIKTEVMEFTKSGLEEVGRNIMLMGNPILVSQVFDQLEAIRDIKDPEKFFEIHMIKNPLGIKFTLYKDSVVTFSGPSVIMIGAKLVKAGISYLEKRSFTEQIPGYNYSSNQSFGFKATAETIADKTNNESKLGAICDVSWTSLGSDAVKGREKVLEDAATVIQRKWKNKK